MQQMMPKSADFDIEDRKAAALEKVAKTNKKSNMGVAEIDAQSKINVATIGAENAAKLGAIDAALKKELSANELDALQSRLEQEIRAADRRSEELLAQGRDAEAARQREFKQQAADRAERLEVLKQQTAIAQTTATADAKLKEAQAQQLLMQLATQKQGMVRDILGQYAVLKDGLWYGTALTEQEKKAAKIDVSGIPGVTPEEADALVEGMAGLFKAPNQNNVGMPANPPGFAPPFQAGKLNPQ